MIKLVFSTLAAASIASASFALEVIAVTESTVLGFKGGGSLTNSTLSIVGPEEFEGKEFAEKGTPVFYLKPGTLKDGFYKYQLTGATQEKTESDKLKLNNGRGKTARGYELKAFSLSGYFVIERGVILPQSDEKEDEGGGEEKKGGGGEPVDDRDPEK